LIHKLYLYEDTKKPAVRQAFLKIFLFSCYNYCAAESIAAAICASSLSSAGVLDAKFGISPDWVGWLPLWINWCR
jgi:hypothetical protein